VRVLVVNAGSSSLKLRVLDDEEVAASRDLDAPRSQADAGELEKAVTDMGAVDAVGHRIVHGGTRFREPVILDEDVMRELEDLVELAPLHQPKSLAAAAAVSAVLPEVPAVACFDTAFHATLPAAAATYALPAAWRERWELRRYGFHGLSHAWAARRSAQLLGRSELRLVTCHLGAGASLAAVRDGTCVDTTMGFTPLEGLVMATRSGSVDPGLLLWLLEREDVTVGEMAESLEHESGLLGLAGTGDMREVVAGAAGGQPDAELAFAVYVHRLRAGIAAMAAAIDGLDALVFTGGVGERAPAVRARAVAGLGFLGVTVDAGANEQVEGDGNIGEPGARVRALVVRSREDLEIARMVRDVLEPAGT
jgi:acetate kinase